MSSVLLALFIFPLIQTAMIGKIGNHFLISPSNGSLSNVTDKQCICVMLQSKQSISALTYFVNNRSCQLWSSNNNSITIQWNQNATVIFINRSEVYIQRIGEFRLSISLRLIIDLSIVLRQHGRVIIV